MQGDFSRDSFDPLRRFTRVLSQQGRVALDADWNEMQSIQLHLLRTLAADLIGPHGGKGFVVSDITDTDFVVSGGHYYVDGFLCDSPAAVSYGGSAATNAALQPFWPWEGGDKLENGRRYLVYLDVWERHLAWPEVDGSVEAQRGWSPTLREPALGGLDTASRAQLVWQVRVLDRWINANGELVDLPDLPDDAWPEWAEKNWPELVVRWQLSRGGLTASTEPPTAAELLSPCAVSPDARYRGVENQLYRVEIHQGGTGDKATFKWSRENGSVLLPVASIDGAKLNLSSWWRDARFGLVENDWVEVTDDVGSLRRRVGLLRRVKAVDRDTMSVVLDGAPALSQADPLRHPVLRRWDQRLNEAARGMGISIAAQPTAGHVLEDGIRVQFARGTLKDPVDYRSGDYWLIPARTSLADIVWPRRQATNGGAWVPEELPPHGVAHHFAPLAVIRAGQAQPLARLIRQIER